MLQEDPELFQLYKDLVVAGIVTAEEFWANRVQVSIDSFLFFWASTVSLSGIRVLIHKV